MTPATSLGFSVLVFAEMIGFEPLPWQRWLWIHALELLPDGRFRFRIILILVARQNGKTSGIEIKNLWKMYVLAAQILGTAQDLDLSEESWSNAVEIAEGVPELAAEIREVNKTNGKKALRLANGARWKVKAPNRRGGRGFSADDVNLDELREHANWFAWGAITKTTLAKRNAQIWAYTNAGDDTSVVLNDLQATGRATVDNPDTDQSVGHFEWSVPDDVRCTCLRVKPDPHRDDCQLADPELHAMANPAYEYTIGAAALVSALNTDPDEVFLTECLCQRVPRLRRTGAIDMGLWARLADKASTRVGDVAIGVDIAQDRSMAAISLYGRRADGLGHLKVVDYLPGTDWIIPRLVAIRAQLKPLAYAMGGATYESMKVALAEVGFEVPEDDEQPQHGQLAVMTRTHMGAGCGQLLDAVRQESLRHADQEQLNDSVECGQVQPSGDALVWSRKGDDGDVSPVVSATAARWVFEDRKDRIVSSGFNIW